MNHFLAPSILTSDFLNLGSEIDMINRSHADWLHLDIMDGVFVPNLSFGFHIIKQAAAISTKPIDTHLMIVDPDRHLERFRECGTERLTVHIEACRHLSRTVNEIKRLGMKAGVAINPHTPVSTLEDIIDDLDMVLIMSVNPGYGGQSFIPNSLTKIERLKKMIEPRENKPLIQVDGGVDFTNARTLVERGVNCLVVGSTIFGDNDPPAIIERLKSLEGI